jgi:TP901 family phage tail tape measure protein
VAFTIKYVYQAVDKFSKPLANAANALDGLVKAQQRFNRAANKSSQMSTTLANSFSESSKQAVVASRRVLNLERAQRKLAASSTKSVSALNKFRGAAGNPIAFGGADGGGFDSVLGGVATGAALLLPLNQAIAFEDAMGSVVKKMDGVAKGSKGYDLLSGKIRNLAEQSNLTAVEVAGVYSAAASAGLSGKEMDSFAKLTMKAAVAFDMPTQDAGDALSKISGQLNIPMGDMEQFTDVVNHLSNSLANVKESELIEVVGRSAGALSSFGAEGDQAGALGAFALQMTPSVEVAGTSLKNLMMDMGKLAQDSPSLAKAIEINPTAAIGQFAESLKKMPKNAMMDFIDNNFLEDSAQLVLKLVNNTDKYTETMSKLSEKSKIAGSTQGEFDAVMALSSSSMQQSMTKVTNFTSQLGAAFLPTLVAVGAAVGFVFSFMSEWGDVFIPLGAGVMGVAAAILSMQSALTVAKIAMAAFNVVANMNPIGLIVIAISGLVAALIAAYNKFEAFRNIVDSAWSSVKSFFGFTDDAMGDVTQTRNIIENRENAIVSANSNASGLTQQWAKSSVELVVKDSGNNLQSVKSSSSSPVKINGYTPLGSY